MLMVKLDVYYLSFKKIIYKKNIKKKNVQLWITMH